jgi:hypothetical protein
MEKTLMVVDTRNAWSRKPSVGRTVGLAGALVAWTVAGLAGLAIAFALTAALVIAGVLGAAVLAVGRAFPRRAAASSDDDIIEARNIGGHTWVAYGHR